MSATTAETRTWFTLERVERRWAISPVPLVIVGVWAAFVGTLHFLGQQWGEPIVLCAMKRTTGVPCPGCRGTRAAFALGQGDLPAALVFNPLATAALLAVAGWAVLRFGFGRRVRMHRSSRARAAACVGLAVAVLLNWAYVIYAGG